MTIIRTRREDVYPSDNYEALIQSLKSAIASSLLERDQQSEDNNNITTVRVLKNRYSGEVGVATRLKYDLSTCKFYETKTDDEPEFDVTADF